MKVLIITSCKDCPFHAIVWGNTYREDERDMRCMHPDAIEHEPHSRKLKNEWSPLNICPLPNYESDGDSTAT